MAISVEDPRVLRSKESIRQATLELLSEGGDVGAISIERISERSGAAKTTIYRHWGDKNELVLDVLESNMAAPSDPDSGNFGSDLRSVAVGLARGLRDPKWSAMMASLINAEYRDAGFRALHRRFADQRQDVVRKIVDRARNRGEIRSDIADDEIIDLVGGPLFYRRMLAGMDPDDAYARRMADLVVNMVSPKDGKP